MKKSNGFTMAEVLITLGIIGVVAAITLPALIEKVDFYVRKQQFKKVYNTLSSALARTFADNGGYYSECYYDYGSADPFTNGSECAELVYSLKNRLNILKVCNNNALEGGCISSEMKGTDTILKESDSDLDDEDILLQTGGCAGFREANIKNRNAAWVLSDGTIIGFYGSTLKLFFVDINGLKRPNKWGYDIFGFSLVGDGKYVKIDPSKNQPTCTPVEEGGYSAKEMMDLIYRE